MTSNPVPDEEEPQIPKKAPQSARVNGDQAKRVESNPTQTDLARLSEQELKSKIITTWKKHQELAKKDLAPMLYWLREKLGAQGARNDLTQNKHRGWELWVTEHLDISRPREYSLRSTGCDCGFRPRKEAYHIRFLFAKAYMNRHRCEITGVKFWVRFLKY